MIKCLTTGVLLFVYGFSCTPLQAQDGRDELGNWVMYFGLNRLNEHWSVHSEVQWRNHEVTPNLEQLLLRTGLNYHINAHFMATGGYGYVGTHPYDQNAERISAEHRIWQQFIIRNRLTRLHFEHRYRYEQRWVNRDFSQRIRYRLLINLALNDPDIKKGTFLLSFYNELFAVPEYGEIFDRNRLYGALGYQLSPNAQVQLGFMRQSLPNFSKNYLQLALFLNPDFRK